MTFSSLSSSVYLKQCEAIIAERYQDDFKENSLIANVTARRNRMNVDRKVNTLLHLGSILTSTLELEELQKRILKDAVELVVVAERDGRVGLPKEVSSSCTPKTEKRDCTLPRFTISATLIQTRTTGCSRKLKRTSVPSLSTTCSPTNSASITQTWSATVSNLLWPCLCS